MDRQQNAGISGNMSEYVIAKKIGGQKSGWIPESAGVEYGGNGKIWGYNMTGRKEYSGWILRGRLI